METDDGWRRSILSWKDRFALPYKPTFPPPIGRLTLTQSPTTYAPDVTRDPGDTGTTIWDGALVLAAAVAAHPAATVAGRRVVELGSGCGLVGVVAAKAGAAATVLTDLHSVLPLLRQNVRRNAPYGGGGGGGSGSGAAARPPAAAPIVAVRECKWGDAADMAAVVAALGGLPDVVLASDVVYADSAVAPLVATLSALLPPGSPGSVLWAQETHRPEPIAAFQAALAAGGWELADVGASLADPAVSSAAIRVVRIRRAQGQGRRAGGGGSTAAACDARQTAPGRRPRKRRKSGAWGPGTAV